MIGRSKRLPHKIMHFLSTLVKMRRPFHIRVMWHGRGSCGRKVVRKYLSSLSPSKSVIHVDGGMPIFSLAYSGLLDLKTGFAVTTETFFQNNIPGNGPSGFDMDHIITTYNDPTENNPCVYYNTRVAAGETHPQAKNNTYTWYQNLRCAPLCSAAAGSLNTSFLGEINLHRSPRHNSRQL
jgi:hypothetical protein